MAGSAPTLTAASRLLPQGLLEHAPDAWLQLLFRGLTNNDKLALFKASRQTASLVIRYCPSVHLVLTGQRASEALHKAEQAITQRLLGVGCITVHVDLECGPQPFPYELTPNIHKLSLQGPFVLPLPASPAVETSWLQFNSLTALKELCMSELVSESLVISLCTALEAGFLPCLEHFTDSNFSNRVGSLYPENSLQRLANALGASVRVMHVQAAWADTTLLSCLHLVQVLHSLELSHCCRMGEQVVRQLCEHSTLLSVEMRSIYFDTETFNDFKCRSWKTLIVGPYAGKIYELLALPLNALQTVTVRASRVELQLKDAQAIPQLLPLGCTVTWMPHSQFPDTVAVFFGKKGTCTDIMTNRCSCFCCCLACKTQLACMDVLADV